MGHLNTVLHAIERTRPADRTEFLKPLADVAERLRRRGIVVVVSDLYDEPARVMDGLRRLSYRGNDVIVFHLLDPAELDFDFAGSAQFVDMETGAEMHVVPEILKAEYRRIVREQTAYYERECQKERIDYALLDTGAPLDHALFTYLLRRERLY
jgi:dienelactone hydrolase